MRLVLFPKFFSPRRRIMGRHRLSRHRVGVVEWLDVITWVGQVDDSWRQVRRWRELGGPGVGDEVVDPADAVAGVHVEGAVQGLHFPHAIFLHEIVFVVVVAPATYGHDEGDAAHFRGAVVVDGGDVLELLVVDQDASGGTDGAEADVHVFEDTVFAEEDAAAADFEGAVVGP